MLTALLLLSSLCSAQTLVRPPQIRANNQVRVSAFDRRGSTGVWVAQIRPDYHLEQGWPYLCATQWWGDSVPLHFDFPQRIVIHRDLACLTEYSQCLYDHGTPATCAGKSQQERP